MPDHTVSEPSMDEILASIRRIISEDGPAPDAAAAPAAVSPPAETTPQPEPPAAELAPEPTEPPQPAKSAPEPAPAAPEVTQADDALVGDEAAAATASAFQSLVATAHEAVRPQIALPAPGRTLEDLTAELLRPLLKAWLDENLPDIVRDRVDEEVRRIARGRVR